MNFDAGILCSLFVAYYNSVSKHPITYVASTLYCILADSHVQHT